MADDHNNSPEQMTNDTINSSGVKNVAGKAAKAAGKAMARAMKALSKKVFLALAKFFLPVLIVLVVVFFLFFFIYMIEFEFSGTEQQYTNQSNNELEYNQETNQLEATNLSSENAAIKDLYKYYGGKSYYQIIGSDNSQLISPDDENAIQDYYGNEKIFALNENFLYSLDRFVFGGKFYYPEQFTKPVPYDEDTLMLKPITEDGALTITSKTPSFLKDKIKSDEMLSVRDYGFGAIMKYNNTEDWKKTVTMEGTYNYQDVWDEAQQKVVKKKITPEPFSYDLYSEDINLLEKVITFKGEIEFNYSYEKTKKEKLYDGESVSPEAKVTKILYDTYTYVPKILVGHDADGFPIYEDGKYVKYNLYKYRSAESGVYEEIPVASGNNINDKGTDYIYEYLRNFESSIPDNVIESYDFAERIDYDSSIFDSAGSIQEYYKIPFGTAIKTKSFEKSLPFLDIASKYGAEFGVDPYLLIAMIAQESGGNPKINADGLMQITFSTPIKVKDAKGVTQTVKLAYSDRQNPELNIRMGAAYLKQMIDQFDGDVFKAVSAYNLGPGTIARIKTINPEAYADDYDWLMYREASRLKSGGMDSRSANYKCMEFPEGKKTSGKVWGDSCYLENVMRYYVGKDLSKIDDAEGFNLFKVASNFFMNLIRPKEKENNEEITERDFRKSVVKPEVDDILKMTIALENKEIFSNINLNDSLGELSFWDEGFMESFGLQGLSLQELMNITANEDGFLPPVIMQNGATVTSRFGPRIHPVTKKPSTHTGVDIAAPIGTPIYASAGGKVVHASPMGTYGNVVFIDHGNGTETRYAHLSKFNTTVGSVVNAGQVIGYMGSTGRSTGSHLHFEIRVNGVAVDPISAVLHQGTTNTDSNLGNKVVNTTKKLIGSDFSFDGVGPSAFSEMGLVSYVYKNSGYTDIPTTFKVLSTSGITKTSRTVRAGDILIIDNKYPAIYIGYDKMIFASESLEKVAESVVYWNKVTRVISFDSSPGVSVTPGSSVGVKALEYAKTKLGVKYQWGAEGSIDYDGDGDTRPGYDCSGLFQWAFNEVGYKLPRTTLTQYKVGNTVNRNNVQVGDLIYFKYGNRGAVDHVAMYIGDNKILHASQSHGKVVITEVFWKYVVTIKRH